MGRKTKSVIGMGLLAVLAAALLLFQSTQTSQATMAMFLGIRFDGEYRIGSGDWKPITAGEHISATKGDVTLRGSFSLLEPFGGEYIETAGQGTSISLYLNHISCEVQEPGFDNYRSDAEIPELGADACGRIWTSYTLRGDGDGPIIIRLHNPHRLGNEEAVDDFLNACALYRSGDFEKQMQEQYKLERTVGFASTLAAFAVFGIALFSTGLHLTQSQFFWQTGFLSLFAGGYFLFGHPAVCFQSWLVSRNTTIPGICMMLYMLLLTVVVTQLAARSVRWIGVLMGHIMGLICGVSFLVPMVSTVRFYDVTVLWAAAQCVVCLVLMPCLLRDFGKEGKARRLLRLCAMLSMIAFVLDCAAAVFGWWQDGQASRIVFVLCFAAVMIWSLWSIPRNILEAERVRQLEGELDKSRIAIMMSQIKPHFIYNTLGSIEQLCQIQPDAAAGLVHNFAKYLRGNLGELDNPAPIRISREMEHVRCYVSIEKTRFPDITVNFDLQSQDFLLPALSVQPLVENAIKHGLMKLPQGGTVTVSTYETDAFYCVRVADTGAGFDTGTLWENPRCVGLRNIRTRLEAMCGGTLTVESTPGLGTTVTIQIPREG